MPDLLALALTGDIDRYRQARRRRRAMRCARHIRLHGPCDPTPADLTAYTYGATGIRLTDDEARDALTAELLAHGRRLTDPDL
ncbi:hypothetical protein [Streptomyces sp. Ac-502]|uniref:hypothetical protein n=1 Tax=Streptomyces sp. Ac-502 TaxID=3342801 RepID=UPI0038623CF5